MPEKQIKVIDLTTSIPAELAEKRLDQALAALFPEYSRSKLKEWIEKGQVLVNGQLLRPKDKVFGNESIEIKAELEQQSEDWEAEHIPLNIIFEDPHLLVINKPAGLVVHPAAGNRAGTLVNALLHHAEELKNLPRAGIVHRLDKDTTGLLVVAKTLQAHNSLVSQLQARSLKREYEAVVWGMILSGGTIDGRIARHPQDRKRMAVVETGKEAITHYRVLKKFKSHTHLQIKLETGRTHQIRVHLSYIHHPIVGDKTYGGRLRVPPKASPSLLELLRNFSRQALHARRLGLIHPETGEEMLFEAAIPEDFKELLDELNKNELKAD